MIINWLQEIWGEYEADLHVINTSWAVLKIRPEKIFMPVQHGIWMHDLCDTGFFFFFQALFSLLLR